MNDGIIWRALLAVVCVTAAIAQSPERVTRDLKGAVTDVVKKGRVLVTVSHNDMRRNSVDPLAEGFAAADGSFQFEDVPWFEKQEWGFNTVLIIARSGNRVDALTLRGENAVTDKIELELDKAIEVRGVLLDDQRLPIANAWVWPAIFGKMDPTPNIWLTAPLLPWHTRTDAEGKFVLKGLPDIQPLKLVAGGDNHARRWIDVEDASEPVEAELQSGGRITGTVLMPDGTPAKRVHVQAAARGVGYGIGMTDDQGRFTLSSLAADLYKVWAEAEDLTVIAVQNLKVEPGETVEDQVVQLVKGGFIVGSIVDAKTGKPIVPGPHTDVAMYGPARGSGGACQCTPVRADGTFRIRAPAGTNRIYLRAAMGWSEPTENVTVVEGEETKVEWKVNKGSPRRRR